mmetsp:Transcript_3107/g.4535  ORF Transcript_3107/g.4535 Transcript_3107/m.4535 type:complete len:256 (-) Transcript_3107:1095-1862(-)
MNGSPNLPMKREKNSVNARTVVGRTLEDVVVVMIEALPQHRTRALQLQRHPTLITFLEAAIEEVAWTNRVVVSMTVTVMEADVSIAVEVLDVTTTAMAVAVVDVSTIVADTTTVAPLVVVDMEIAMSVEEASAAPVADMVTMMIDDLVETISVAVVTEGLVQDREIWMTIDVVWIFLNLLPKRRRKSSLLWKHHSLSLVKTKKLLRHALKRKSAKLRRRLLQRRRPLKRLLLSEKPKRRKLPNEQPRRFNWKVTC